MTVLDTMVYFRDETWPLTETITYKFNKVFKILRAKE